MEFLTYIAEFYKNFRVPKISGLLYDLPSFAKNFKVKENFQGFSANFEPTLMRSYGLNKANVKGFEG